MYDIFAAVKKREHTTLQLDYMSGEMKRLGFFKKSLKMGLECSDQSSVFEVKHFFNAPTTFSLDITYMFMSFGTFS